MSLKYKILLSIAVLAITFTAGRFSSPTKIETKEVVKTVVVKEEAKTKIIYRNKVTKSDGTVIEKEVEKEESRSKEIAESEKQSESLIRNDIGLILSVLGTIDTSDITKREYSVIASKRLIGSLYGTAGVTTSTKGEIKLSGGIGWGF